MFKLLTDYLIKRPYQPIQAYKSPSIPLQEQDGPVLNSSDIIRQIYKTINTQKHHESRSYKQSISSEDTDLPNNHQKCNCKKSKCLKLYCQCFARGSYCKDCNCDCCQNTSEFGQIRAKAIDEILQKSSLSFNQSSNSFKGCNCKKSGCQKKYCQCFHAGVPCTEMCKCCNCQNISL